MHILVATESSVILVEPSGAVSMARQLDARPTCLAVDHFVDGCVWCGTHRNGVFRSDDGGASWRPVGLDGHAIMSLAASPTEPDVVWAGTEPSELWRSGDGGTSWTQMRGLEALPSSSEWAFPPKPSTHHVRWIACHPGEPGRLWLAIEAGALISTPDGGRTWHDRVPGGPYDTHEMAIHPAAPDTFRVAAGDGYYESHDARATWSAPRDGFEVNYLRSVAIDPGRPDVVIVSAAPGPYVAYAAGRSEGSVYRRAGTGDWERITDGWPDPPATIAPLLTSGRQQGEFWAADERGVHRSDDGGSRWHQVGAYGTSVQYLRGIVVVG